MYRKQVSSFREKLNSRILRPAGAGGAHQGSWATGAPLKSLLTALPGHRGHPGLRGALRCPGGRPSIPVPPSRWGWGPLPTLLETEGGAWGAH